MSVYLPSGYFLKGESYVYKIEKILGRGTFGITYLATTSIKVAGTLGEIEIELRVAVKEFFMKDINDRSGTDVIIGSNSDIYCNYRKDFIREANNLSRLKHPAIVKVLEAFERNNTAYFAMEYIEGGCLNNYIQSNDGLSEQEALRGIEQIANALLFMHSNKMLHLDIKPLNIMRRSNGDWVLIDFGLSKQFNSDGEPESSTHIGTGTMGYAPLEQANYKKSDGFRPTLDLYALGATLFKTLTGMTPPDASTLFNDGFPENLMRNKGIGEDMIMLTSWAMEPMVRKRPQTAGEFINEIHRILPKITAKPKKTVVKTAPANREDTIPSNVWSELCNGFHVKWEAGLSESRKANIRELLQKMEKIGEEERFVFTEHGKETVAKVPVMSLGDFSRHYLKINEYQEFPSNIVIRNLFKEIQQLEVQTSLSFRLSAKSELRYVHSAPVRRWENLFTIFYSMENGFQYRTYCDDCDATGFPFSALSDCGGCDASLRSCHDLNIKYLDLNNWGKINDFQIVCDGLETVFNEHGFNVPCTQEYVEEVRPIGFGLYAIRKGKLWNIRALQSPLYSYLPDDYDSISVIGVWHIPGGGPWSGYDYLGIKAVRNDITFYYSFNKHVFTLEETLSSDDIRDRELWT